MFKLEPNPTFWAGVEIHVPGQGKGKIEVEFRYLDRAARAAYFETVGDKTNIAALGELVVGWREIDAPFNQDNLGRLLDIYPGAASALFDAFLNELAGVATKN
jgi:hypothetical protein